MAAIDFAKFKKISSDDKVTTLRHPAGHTVNIAHNVLHPKLKAELDKIPMHKQNAIKEFAEGSKDGPIQNEDPDNEDQGNQEAPKQPQGPVVINVGQQAPAQGNQPPAPAPIPQQQAPQQPQVAPVPVPAQGEEDQSQDEGASLEPQPDASAPGVSPNVPAAPQAPAASPADNPQTQAPQAPVAAPMPDLNTKPGIKNYLDKESQAWEQDLTNGHITPETYGDLFAKKSTLGKISTLFGLLVGGAGAGLTHTANPVMEMMQNEINNDLDAQKNSKTNAQNFIKLGQQHLVNEAQNGLTNAQAEAIIFPISQTKAMQTSFNHLVKETNDLPEGDYKKQRQQVLGMLYNQMGAKINDINDAAAGAAEYAKNIFGSPNGASGEQQFQNQTRGMRMMGPVGEARAKDIEEKHFPGLPGQASAPLTSGDKDKIDKGIQFQNQLKRFKEWTAAHSGDLSISDRAYGQALANSVANSYRDAISGGVYKEGEQHFISKSIDPNPTKFFNNIRVLPKLQAVQDESSAQLDQHVKNLGFPGYPGAKQAGKSQSSSDIVMFNGKQYRRGPNGKPIEVK